MPDPSPLTDDEVLSSFVFTSLRGVAIAGTVMAAAAIAVFLWGTWLVLYMTGVSLGVIFAAVWGALRPLAPWRTGLFRAYTGLDAGDLPETAFQTAIANYVGRPRARLAIFAAGSVGVVWPWIVGFVSRVAALRPINGADIRGIPWPVGAILGLFLGSSTAMLVVSAISRYVLANKERFGARSAAVGVDGNDAAAAGIPEGFGSIGYFLRARRISRGRFATWVVCGFLLTISYGYCKGRAKRLATQHSVDQPYP